MMWLAMILLAVCLAATSALGYLFAWSAYHWDDPR